MNKSRVEALSDGVFAIVLTILVFDIKLPAVMGTMTDGGLWWQLYLLWPILTSFALSFLVICVFWINHNFLFHVYVKAVDRGLNLLNMLYLLFLVFVPFVAHLVGAYPTNHTAALVYGLTIFAISVMTKVMFLYVQARAELHNELPSRFQKQGHVRMTLTIVLYFLGIVSSLYSIPLAIFFYLFPMIFNLIPGSLDFVERIFRFELA